MQLCYSECVRLSQDGSTIKMASRPDVMLKVVCTLICLYLPLSHTDASSGSNHCGETSRLH